MVEAAPAAPLEMPEANLLFKLAIIAFYAPAQLGCIDQFAKGDTGVHRGEPVFCRFGFIFGPLDQQPLLWARFVQPVIPMGGPNPQPGEARLQPVVRSLAPGYCLPGILRQTQGQRFDCDWLMFSIAAQPCRRPSLARPLLGCSGAVPGAQAVAPGPMPMTYWNPSAVTSSRNSVSLP